MAIYNVQNISKLQLIEINGDLRIRGYSGNDLIVDAEGPHVQQSTNEGFIALGTDGDCDLKVPDHIYVEINTVNGDCKITNLMAGVSINEANGDLAIRHIEAPVTIGTCNGDLSLKHIAGEVRIEEVNGDCSVQRIETNVWVGTVHGSLALSEIEGDIEVAESSSDIGVEVEFSPGHRYNFSTTDDMAFTLFPEPDVTFHIPAETEYTFSRELKNIANITVNGDGQYMLIHFGDGTATVEIHEVDDLAFTTRGSTNSGFGVNFDLNLGDQLKDIETQINESLSGLGQMIEAQTREALASASQFAKDLRVEARIQRAKERAERRVERHGERADRQAERAKRFDKRFDGRRPPMPPMPPVAPVSSEERLLILQMLQDGKITVEEANKLLNTLEGK